MALIEPILPAAVPFLQALADIILRNDWSILLKDRVSVGVVVVVMGVANEANGFVSDAFQGCLNFVRQRGVLVIDDDNAVLSYRSSNVSTCALQHVDRAGYMRDFHFDFA